MNLKPEPGGSLTVESYQKNGELRYRVRTKANCSGVGVGTLCKAGTHPCEQKQGHLSSELCEVALPRRLEKYLTRRLMGELVGEWESR